MGNFGEADRKESMYLKQLNEKFRRDVQLSAQAYEIRMRQIEEENRRFNEINNYNFEMKMRNDIQKQEDNNRREYILKLQHFVGYNLDPYNMSSSELKYWHEKIKKEVKKKEDELDRYNNRINNRINSYNSYSNNFYY
jgi:DNA-binding protein H-NS